MKDLFFKNLERALNAYLFLDPESKHRIAALQGKIATVELAPLPLTCQLIFTDHHIEVKEESLLPHDVKITGTPLRVVSMMMAKDKKSFFAEDIQIEGDSELGQQIVDVFDRLEIDWEEYLSRLIGDTAAHKAGSFTKNVKNWLQETRDALWQNTNEYLHEEADFFPAREALQDFFSDIDQLRMDVDRLEARIKQLQQNEEEQQ